MTMNTVGSSDLDLARDLSRRLSGAEPDVAPPVVEDSPYLRFSPSAPGRDARGEDGPPPTDEELNDFTRWDELLAWALNKVRSSAAFAVDPQGFVIGSSGNVPEDGFEGTGAELSYVMSQADAMDPEMGGLESVELGFGNRRLAGFRARSAVATGFVIAFIDPEIFTAETREQIAHQLEHSFAVLL
jgi:hypothetical protein